MNPQPDAAYIAFEGDRCIASGDLGEVARAAKQALDRTKTAVAVFDGRTSAPVELDLRGSLDQVLARLPQALSVPAADGDAPTAPRGPGRPKLGVVAREITLLPRHWEWLSRQPGGASVAIRKLVDQARRTTEDSDRARAGADAAYRFMSAMSGNRPHYEEAIRALFAGDAARFERLIGEWPADIRDHALRLAMRAFHRTPQASAS
ncbi:MAG TPA: DUF2239 family protein [Bradyrhizobium sp.]|nr:DUF2239 family protein [Bradyrhizobium sp.]